MMTWNFVKSLIYSSIALLAMMPLAGCEVEVDEGPLEDAAEELAED